MSHMELNKALAAADTFIFNLWSVHKDNMLGHGARVDESGMPYVVVFSKRPIRGILPTMQNGIPIRNEVVNDLNEVVKGPSQAPKKGTTFLNALICVKCGFEFAIISLATDKPTSISYCPVCAEGLKSIKSIRLALTETESQFELSKSIYTR